MDQIKECEVFKDMGKAKIDPKSRQVSNAPTGHQNIRVHLVLGGTKPDLLLEVMYVNVLIQTCS